jgi:hypothetical protein
VDRAAFRADAAPGWEELKEPIRPVGLAGTVAQVSNLLYRSASSLRGFRILVHVRFVGNPADWKSAIQQVGNLRYFALLTLPIAAELGVFY